MCKRNAVVLNIVQLQIREFLSSLLGMKRKKKRKSGAMGSNKEKGSKAITAVRFLNSVKSNTIWLYGYQAKAH